MRPVKITAFVSFCSNFCYFHAGTYSSLVTVSDQAWRQFPGETSKIQKKKRNGR